MAPTATGGGSMAGKPIVCGSTRIAYVMHHISKNTLADIILDRIGAEIGEDATDEQVLACLQPWLETVARLRGDRPISLTALLALAARFDRGWVEG